MLTRRRYPLLLVFILLFGWLSSTSVHDISFPLGLYDINDSWEPTQGDSDDDSDSLDVAISTQGIVNGCLFYNEYFKLLIKKLVLLRKARAPPYI